MAVRPIKWRPNFLGGRPQVGGVNIVLPYSETIVSAAGTTYNVVHGLGVLRPSAVTVLRIAVPAGTTFPLGLVVIRWVPVDVNTLQLDFDTYTRTASEFHVTVTA